MSYKEIEYSINENECWICTSHSPNNDGYFTIRRNGIRERMHRYIYKLHNGDIPEDMVIRHTCDNASCINPEHLIIGTQQQNIQDKVDRNRNAIGLNNGRSKLNEDQVTEIYLDRVTQRSILARKYNVDSAVIRDIQSGKTWTSVTCNLKYIPYEPEQHFSKLTPEHVIEIYLDKTSTHRELSYKYPVNESTIRRIRNDQSWISITKDL